MKEKSSFISRLGNLLRVYTIIIVLVGVVIFFSVILKQKFLDMDNIFNTIRAVSMVGLVCCGYSFVMISGGTDISTGWAMCLSMAVMAKLMVERKMHPVIAVAVGILICIFFQLFNVYVGIITNLHGFIVTLASQYIIRGATMIYTGARNVVGLPPGFNYVGQKNIANFIPAAIVILFFAVIITHIVLNKTVFGRYVFALGGNIEAARLSGINVNKVRVMISIWCGFFIGMASYVMLSRLNAAYPTAAMGYEFRAILACSIGGISFSGGIGKVYGMICGAIVLGIIANGLALMGVNEYYQYIVNGFMMIGAVLLDQGIQKSIINRAKQVQAREQLASVEGGSK